MTETKTKRRRFKFNLQEEINKVNFDKLEVQESPANQQNRTISVIDRSNGEYLWYRMGYRWDVDESKRETKFVSKVGQKIVSFSFENHSNGLHVTLSGVPNGNRWRSCWTFIVEKWERNKVLANLVAAFQAMSGIDCVQDYATYDYDYSSRKRIKRTSEYKQIDKSRRNALVRHFEKSKQNFIIPKYLQELLDALESVIEHKATMGRENLKNQVRDAFRILQSYGYNETDVLCLWREITAETILGS